MVKGCGRNGVLKPKHDILKNHAASSRHQENSKSFSTSRKITDCFQIKESEGMKRLTQKAEAGLILFILNHAGIKNIDHLSPLCKLLFPNAPQFALIKLHRTKCSAVIKNIFYPFFKKKVI